MRTITATEASRNFSDLLDAIERGETVTITRGHHAVAEMRSVRRRTGLICGPRWMTSRRLMNGLPLTSPGRSRCSPVRGPIRGPAPDAGHERAHRLRARDDRAGRP